MINIYTVREYHNKKTDVVTTPRIYFGKQGASVEQLFAKINTLIDVIPEEERWNLHYSLGRYTDTGLKKFESQSVIPIDIDDIDVEKIEEYIRCVEEVVNLTRHEMGVVASGHGLHFLLGLKKEITDESYFKKNLSNYKMLCGDISQKLYFKGLKGGVDPGPFRLKATLRLPETRNVKENKDDTFCKLLYGRILPKVALSSLVSVDETIETIESIKEYPTPDIKAVQECLFLKYCKENQQVIKEPQWYALLTIISKLDETLELCHEYSKEHSGYSEATTQEKAEYSRNIGPRTCTNIDSLWHGCSGCEYYGKCISPVMIQGDDHISTEKTGFHHVTITGNGGIKHTPDYEGLRRFFRKTNPFIVTASKMCYIWAGTHWKYLEDVYLENFAQEHFNPAADNRMVSEFKQLVLRTSLHPESWFNDSTTKKMNFKNGILSLDTMEFSSHDQAVGFRNTLPYDYDPHAKSPIFDRFMREVTKEDDSLTNILMEFAGYAFSGGDCRYEVALILKGDGANGKSTFMRVLMAAAGKEAYSSLSLPELGNEQHRAQMVGRLFNISEETPTQKSLASDVFKKLTTGGDMTIKIVYKPSYSVANNSKFIIACNELPSLDDCSPAMFRRMIIVPFDACFTGKADYDLIDKLKAELPGIFNKIIRGYHRLDGNKGNGRTKFTKSDRADIVLQDYQYESDDVGRWFEENTKWVDPPAGKPMAVLKTTTRAEIMEKYKANVGGMEARNMTLKSFSARIGKFIPKNRQIRRRIEGSHAKNYIHGLQFNIQNKQYEQDF